jgi:hypothetical protein
MPRRPTVSNSGAAAKAVRSLRRRESLDETGELLAVLLVTVADLVDQVMATDSDVPAYARAQVARAHLGVIAELREALGAPVDDAWSALLLAAAGSPGPAV